MRRVGTALILSLWLCLAAGPGRAEEPDAAPPRLSLLQALRTAMREHPSLRRLQENRLAAQAREQSSNSDVHPRVALEGLLKDGPTGAPGFGLTGLVNSIITNKVGASVVLSQIVDDAGRTEHRTLSRHHAVAALRADEQTQRVWLAVQVYRSYYQALLDRRLVDLGLANVQSLEVAVRQADLKLRAGLASRVDLRLAQSSLAAARVDLIRSRNDLLRSIAELNSAMGVDGPAAYSLEDLPPEAAPAVEPATSPEEDVASALRQRPEMASLESQIRAAAENSRAVRAADRPLVRGLVTSGIINVAPENSNQNHVYGIGMTLIWPLYTGGQVEADVAEADHQVSALLAGRDEAAVAIRLQVQRARLALQTLVQSQPAVREQLESARDSLQLALRRYEVGLGNMVELQAAQVAEFSAETAAARLRYEIAAAQAALAYATGSLQPDYGEGTP